MPDLFANTRTTKAISHSDDLNLLGVALLLHRSKDWMHRHWREMVRDEGFPPPFVGARPGSQPWWTRASVEAWKTRGGGLAAAEADFPAIPVVEQRAAPAPPAANDAQPRPVAPGGRVAALLAAAGR